MSNDKAREQALSKKYEKMVSALDGFEDARGGGYGCVPDFAPERVTKLTNLPDPSDEDLTLADVNDIYSDDDWMFQHGKSMIRMVEWDDHLNAKDLLHNMNMPETTGEMEDVLERHIREEQEYKAFRKAHDEKMQQENPAEAYDRAMGIIE